MFREQIILFPRVRTDISGRARLLSETLLPRRPSVNRNVCLEAILERENSRALARRPVASLLSQP